MQKLLRRPDVPAVAVWVAERLVGAGEVEGTGELLHRFQPRHVRHETLFFELLQSENKVNCKKMFNQKTKQIFLKQRF